MATDKSGSKKWAGKRGQPGRDIARRNQVERKLAREAANAAVPF